MWKILQVAFFVLFASIALASTASMTGTSHNETTLKILTVGDSITRGVGGDADGTEANDFGYRSYLQTHLGVGAYDFVGSNTTTDPGIYDPDHWGTSGQIASWFVSRIHDELDTSLILPRKLSKVLLHVGTNDIILQYIDDVNKKTNAQIITSITSVITSIFSYYPDVELYVALIVPDRRTGQEVFWGAFHDDLNVALTALQVTYPNLIIVDMYEAFINDTYGDCLGDWYDVCMNPFSGDHPSATGYRVMARQWYECMQSRTAVNCNGN